MVGGPVSNHHEYCYESFVKTVKNLTYPHFDIFFVDNSQGDDFYNKLKKDFPESGRIPYHKNVKVRLAESRNLVREKVLKEGYDYLFCLDQDVLAPTNILQRLVAFDKKIVTGLYDNYFTRVDPATGQEVSRKLPVVWVKYLNDPLKLVTIRRDILESGRLIKVHSSGTGCILIHREVLEKIKFRWEDNKPGVDDVFFCIDALSTGFEIFADTSLRCEHIIEGRPVKWGEGDMKV